MVTRKKLSEQLRDSILNADKTRYQIAKDTGVTEGQLSRFVNRVAGLSLDSIDKVGECLDLEFATRRTRRKRRKN